VSRRAYITPENAPDSFQCRELFVPTGQSWQAIVAGALSSLADPGNYEQVGGLTPEQTAAIFDLMFSAWDAGKGCPMFAGMITMSGRSDAPDDWLLCDGEAYLIAQYPALYNAIGVTFGTDGTGTFRVPDLRSRGPIGVGSGAGLTARTMAETGGAETHQLTVAELASHTHKVADFIVSTGAVNGLDPALFKLGIDVGNLDTGNTGSGTAHNNMPPWLALNFFIYAGQ
jgi:microcystin-dependent protein